MRALRVTELARERGLHASVHDRLMDAYWAEGRNIGDPEELRSLVVGAGLDAGEVDDVLVERVSLPRPERGDLVAVPATGAYTLAMASNYNAVPRPAAVLVADGNARLIRRRETIDDLLALEA